jgi:hypothetical protein
VISSKLHGRQASIRQSTIRAKSKQPMPDPNELERRFTKVLVRPDSAFDTDHVLRPRLSVFVSFASCFRTKTMQECRTHRQLGLLLFVARLQKTRIA